MHSEKEEPSFLVIMLNPRPAATCIEMSEFTFVTKLPELRESRLDELLHECGWHWLVDGEMNRSLGRGEPFEFVLKRFDHRRSWEQTAMIRERGKPHHDSLVLESRYAIANDLDGLRRHNGPDRRTNLSERATGRFRNAIKVFSNSIRSSLVFRCRTAFAGFRLVHVYDTLQGLLIQVHHGGN